MQASQRYKPAQLSPCPHTTQCKSTSTLYEQACNARPSLPLRAAAGRARPVQQLPYFLTAGGSMMAHTDTNM